jgi:hypothetical protein
MPALTCTPIQIPAKFAHSSSKEKTKCERLEQRREAAKAKQSPPDKSP